MSVQLTDKVYQAILQHGEKDYPYECCGFLIGESDEDIKKIDEIRQQENERDESRETRYLIHPEEFMAAERYARKQGKEMLGIYHSHPDHPSRPSNYDREHAWPWYAYLILSVQDGEAATLQAWQLTDDRSKFDEIELLIPKGSELKKIEYRQE